MKIEFNAITPEIIWANKESIFLFAIVAAFILLLINFKMKDKVHKGYAEISQIQTKGSNRIKVYTLQVRDTEDPQGEIVLTISTEASAGASALQGYKRGQHVRVLYRKMTNGQWAITKVLED